MSEATRIRVSPTAIVFLLALSACQSPATASQSPSSIAATIDLPPVSPSPPLPPASLVNGGFETGDLTGWLTKQTGTGKWLVYSDGSTPPVPSLSDPNRPFRMPDPPEGLYAAVTDMKSDGQRSLYQDVQLDAPYILEFVVFYNNGAAVFNSKNGFRADLMSTTATPTSLSPDTS